MVSKFLFSLVALFLLAKAPVASATTINNTTSTTIGTTGSPNSYGSFGTWSNTAFGESMLSPGGMLTSLTFSSITLYSGYGSNARLVIAPISGNTPGSSLFSQQYTLTTGSNTFSNLNVNTTAGSQYFAYLTVDGVKSNAVAYATFGAMTPGSNYSNGVFYYGDEGCDSVVDFSSLAKYDLAFSATFTSPAVAVTPEPSSLMLLATGVMSAGTMLRRRNSLAA